jgi:hypothetical protein
MKRGYSKLLYNQRNKSETIVSVIKRLFGEHITSRLVRTQNREISFRCIAYNTHLITIRKFFMIHYNMYHNKHRVDRNGLVSEIIFQNLY